jgi:tetratricopeptide (TPR) repeat protein
MKKVLVTFVLALTTAAMAQGNSQQQSGVTAKGAKVQVTSEPNQPQQQQQQTQPGQQQPGQQPAQTDQGNQPASQKVIKDPAEYNAYITALNTQDPMQKAAAMEAFVNQYPNSVVKVDAMEQAMAAYQQAGNQAKVEESARKILAGNPNNIRALAIVTFIDRAKATQGDQNALKAVCDESQRGLQSLPTWTKPEGLSDADFQKLRNQMANIFEGAAGFCALQAKNFPVSREHLSKALQIDPTNFGDTFQLAISYLSSTPMDLTGFYYCAHAINLAQTANNAQGATGVNNYCKATYHNYHGNDTGWDQFVQQYGALPTPPAAADLAKAITPKPTPCDIAVQAVQQNDPGTLSFSDWEFILSQSACSPAGKDAADKVWAAIQAKEKNGEAKLQIPVKVISAGKDSIDGAITDENQQANKADVHVVMEKPLLKVPAPGSTIDVIGVLTSYTPNPFMFTMEKGALPAAKKPAARGATKKGGTRKKK